MKKGTEKTKIAAKTLKRVSNIKAPEVKKSPDMPTEMLAISDDLNRYQDFRDLLEGTQQYKKDIEEYNAKNPNKKQKVYNPLLKRISEEYEYKFKGLPKEVATDPNKWDKFDPIWQDVLPDEYKTKGTDRFQSGDIARMKSGAEKVLKKLKKKNAK